MSSLQYWSIMQSRKSTFHWPNFAFLLLFFIFRCAQRFSTFFSELAVRWVMLFLWDNVEMRNMLAWFFFFLSYFPSFIANSHPYINFILFCLFCFVSSSSLPLGALFPSDTFFSLGILLLTYFFLVTQLLLNGRSETGTDFEVTWCDQSWGKIMIIYVELFGILFHCFSLSCSLDVCPLALTAFVMFWNGPRKCLFSLWPKCCANATVKGSFQPDFCPWPSSR